MRWLLVTALACGCADLAPIDADVCGNGIIETGEDCDSAVDDALGDNLACGDPNGDFVQRCRLICTDTSCPDGWGCGADGVCRHGTGRFEEVGRVAMGVDDLAVGDVDGDGALDLIGVSPTAIEVRYGNGDSTFPTALSRRASNQTGTSSIGHIDDDGLLDIAVPLRAGIAASRGTTARDIDPVPASLGIDVFSPESILGHVLAFRRPAFEGTPPTDSVVVLGFTTTGFVFSTGPGQIDPAPELPSGLGPPARSVTGDIDPLSGGPTRDELLLALIGDDRVRLYDLRGPGDVQLVAEVQMPPNVVVSAVGAGLEDVPVDLALLVDEDGDGLLDVVVPGCPSNQFAGLSCEVNEQVFVAHGDGLGGFLPAAVAPRFDALGADCGPMERCRTMPLAAADFDGDGDADYVSQRSAYLDDGVALLRTGAVSAEAPWTWAELGDFNRDGIVDVAGASAGRTGVDIAMGTGDGFFNVQLADTDEPVAGIRAGDFDGDFASDVAIAEHDQDSDVSAVSVVFGVVDGAVEPAIEMIALGRIISFEAGFDLGAAQTTGDRLSDLFVMFGEDLAPTQLAFLSGTSDRAMVNTFGLPRTGGLGLQQPSAAIIGNFLDSEAGSELIAIADSTDDPTLWVLPAVDGDIASPEPDDGQAIAGIVQDFAPACARWLAVDIDGDGIDELLGHGGQDGESARRRECRLVTDATLNPAVFVASLSGSAGAPTLDVSVIDVPSSVFAVTALVAADLDGDGARDVVASYSGGGNALLDGVLVYFGDGRSLSAAVDVPLPVRDGPQPGPAELPSIAIVQADDDPQPELAITLRDGVYIASFDGRTPSVTEAPAAASTIFTGPGDTVTGAGDFDRDGVDDLVVGDTTDVRVFRGIPHTESTE